MGKRDRERIAAKKPDEEVIKQTVIEHVSKIAPHQMTAGVFAEDHWTKATQEVHIRMEPITWGFPMDETIFTRFFENLICHNRPMPWDNIAIARSTYLPQARNTIHHAFVTEHKTKWLVMLDSDILPPPNYITKLFQDITKNPAIKMIGGWYKRKNLKQEPVVYNYVRDGLWEIYTKPLTGITVVEGAGAGCWLMSREVAEAIGEKPYDMLQSGEDLIMCRKVADKGYKLYIDWDIECAHVGVGVY